MEQTNLSPFTAKANFKNSQYNLSPFSSASGSTVSLESEYSSSPTSKMFMSPFAQEIDIEGSVHSDDIYTQQRDNGYHDSSELKDILEAEGEL